MAEPAARKPRNDEIDVFGLSHRGKVRQENQDHFLICSLERAVHVHLTSLPTVQRLVTSGERLAFVGMVADGVGGGQKGEEASRLALEAVTQYVAHSLQCYYTRDPLDEQNFREALENAAMECHANLTERSLHDPESRGMATTLTLWLGVWPRAYLLQVGDSRCYLMRDGTLTQISRDQTMAQLLIDSGAMSRSEASRSQWAHVLSSAIGGPETLPVVTRVDQRWGDIGLLCSDGLTKHVPDDRIRERLMTTATAREGCEALLQDALDAGGTDNVAIIIGRTTRRDGD